MNTVRPEVPTDSRTASLRWLAALGVISWCLYAALALLSRRFSLWTPSVDRPHLLTLSVLAIAFGVYVVAVRLAVRIPADRRLLPMIALFAVAFRLTLLSTTPIQEIDLYRYIWDGHVTACGVSPYRYAPIDVRQQVDWQSTGPSDSTFLHPAGRFAAASPDLQRLTAAVRQSPALDEILRTVHFAELTTPYPPVSQAVFYLAAVTTPTDATTPTHLVVMKGWIVLFDLLTLWAMIGLLRAAGGSVGWCLAYAWCPLVLKEFANSGHLDAIAVFLTTAAVWQLLRIDGRRAGPLLRAAALLGLGIGAKLYPVVLLPIAGSWIATVCGWRSTAKFAGVAIATAAVSLWPMVDWRADAPVVAAETPESGLPPLPVDTDVPRSDAGGPPPPQEGSPETPPAASGAIDSRKAGLATFLSRWRMNDLLFLIVNENLDPSLPVNDRPWFSVVPDAFRRRLVFPLMDRFSVDAASAAFVLSRGLTLGVFSLIVGGLCWRLLHSPRNAAHEKTRGPADIGSLECRVGESVFLTLAWFWLLAPTQNPWYWTWCLPFLPFARSRAWLWVSGLTLAYYLRFWLNAHWPGADGPGPLGPFASRHAGTSFFDFVLVWFEFGPLFGGLLIGWLLSRRRGEE